MSKNLADMQMVVDSMGTLIDGQSFTTYVLITGDRDFVPLVQALRKRGKQVIGMGVRHTSSNSLVSLCDEFVFYDELASAMHKLVEEEIEELLRRAVDQLLQNESQVPASLLKQRMQALSKGTFNRSPQGKQVFSKFLNSYPGVVQTFQDGTTLYICRPSSKTNTEKPETKIVPLAQADIPKLLEKALAELLVEEKRVRASLLKQHMQRLSNGAFDENRHGDKSFRKFLERYKDIVVAEQDGTTLYVHQPTDDKPHQPTEVIQPLSSEEAGILLQKALANLVTEEQTRVRASLLKQEMQNLSGQSFEETRLGFASFRDFLEKFPDTAAIQQKCTTLYVFLPEQAAEPVELHLLYRSELKKRGLRIVPSAVRLCVIKDIISLLQQTPEIFWRELVNTLAAVYEEQGKEEFSKSYVNDVLRGARRAEVVGVHNGGKLATSSVYLQMTGERVFQEAVMRFDLTYLKEIQALGCEFDLEEAAVALYESVGHTRYLKVILNRFSSNGMRS
jgi:hypothetical protein